MKKMMVVLVALIVGATAWTHGKTDVKPITNNPMQELVYGAEKWKTVDVKIVRETNTSTTTWHNK